MNNKLESFLDDFYKHLPGSSDGEVAAIQERLGFTFPGDYVEVIKEFNGGEGTVGKRGHLILYSLEEVIRSNENLKVLMAEIPDYFLFGQDMADTGYAFHRYNRTIHGFGMMSNFTTDPIEFLGNNFTEFLEYLDQQTF